ncbi:hypothetical protein UVI_02002080 [Ustilaginoidea virens]|nr:hypothetical protein UVI_02002080 [Ustilaginoidea virens]
MVPPNGNAPGRKAAKAAVSQQQQHAKPVVPALPLSYAKRKAASAAKGHAVAALPTQALSKSLQAPLTKPDVNGSTSQDTAAGSNTVPADIAPELEPESLASAAGQRSLHSDENGQVGPNVGNHQTLPPDMDGKVSSPLAAANLSNGNDLSEQKSAADPSIPRKKVELPAESSPRLNTAASKNGPEQGSG